MVERRGRSVGGLKRYCSKFLVIMLGLLLVLSLATSAYGEGDDEDTSTSNGTSPGSTVQLLLKMEAKAKATQRTEADPRKRRQNDEWVDFTGAFQYKYPLNLPEGTNNMAPELTLAYNSNVGNGIMGMGWFLQGIPEIRRDFSDQVNYTDSDHFFYNGEKLIKGSDGYYHLWKENFERIEYNSSQNYWVVTQKDGTKFYLGYRATEHSDNTDGRIQAANEPTKIILWSLSKVIDIYGNYYIIEYNEDTANGDYQVARITYTKNDKRSLQALRTIEFSYEPRNDHYVTYSPTKMDLDRRLKWITVKMGNNLLRKYRLDYEYSPGTGRSRLIKILEYGSDGDAPPTPWVDSNYQLTGKTLPPFQIKYRSDSFNGYFHKVTPDGMEYQDWLRNDPGCNIIPGDFDGDGKTDFIRQEKRGWDDDAVTSFNIYFSNGDGTFHIVTPTGTEYQDWLRYDPGCNIIPGDYNGDGKTDFIRQEKNGWDDDIDKNNFNVYLSNGDGTFNIVTPTGSEYQDRLRKCSCTIIPGDYDGDGRTDFIRQIANFIDVYLSKGDGYFTIISNIAMKSSNFNIIPGDFNGDGKIDFLWQDSSSSAADTTDNFIVYLSRFSGGNDYFDEIIPSGPEYQTDLRNYSFYVACNIIPGDFNGDGKTDFIRQETYKQAVEDDDYTFKVYFSRGDGYFDVVYPAGYEYQHMLRGFGTKYTEVWEGGCQIIPGDFNGDGRTDFIRRETGEWARLDSDGTFQIYLSRGNGYFDIFTPAGSEYQYDFRMTLSYGCVIVPGDYDGNGKTDIIRQEGGSWDDDTSNSFNVYFSDFEPYDSILSIINPKNGQICIEYEPAPHAPGAVVPAGKQYPNIANCSPISLVSQIAIKDGLGEEEDHTITYTYSYSNGMIHTGLPFEKANLGFRWIERKNDLTGSVRTYYHQDDLDLRLMVDTEEVYGSDGKSYIEKQYQYQKRLNSSNSEIKFIYASDEYVSNYNGETGTPVTYRVEYGYDAYGNVNMEKDYGDIDVTGDESRIEKNFDRYADSTIYLFLPEYEKKYGIKLDGQEGLAAETRYFYRSNYSLERQEQENGVQDVVTYYDYDDYGNLTAMTDGNGNTAIYTYDGQYQTFLRTKTLKFTEEIIYDDLMRPVQKKDANGQIWETTYDVFSREKSKVSPGDSVASPTTRTTYPDEFLDSGGNPIFPRCLKTENKVADGNYIEVNTYTDGLDRVIQEKSEAKNGWITVDHVYDAGGREYRTSMPYFTTSSTYAAPDSNNKSKSYQFDPIGRLSVTQNSDNTTVQMFYDKQDTLTVDELGHVTNKRIVGNVEYDIQYTGVHPNHTEYSQSTTITACDGIKMINAAGKEFIDQLDMLGRKVSATAPGYETAKGETSVYYTNASFSRSSSAYQQDGTRVEVDQPRFESSAPGFGKAVLLEYRTTVTPGNSFFTTGVADWSLYTEGGATATKESVTGGNFGGKVAKITINKGGTTGSQIQFCKSIGSVTAGQKIACQIRIKASTPTDKAILQCMNDVSAGENFGNKVLNLTTAYQRFEVIATATTAATARINLFLGNVPTGTVIEIDYIGCEIGRAYTTSPHDGSRSIENLKIPTAGISPATGTWEQLVYINSVLKMKGTMRWDRIFSIPLPNGDTAMNVYHDGSDGTWDLETFNDSGQGSWLPATISDSVTQEGKWYRFRVTWTPAQTMLQIYDVSSGAKVAEQKRLNPKLPTGFGPYAYVGNAGQDSFPSTKHDDIRISSIARTDFPDASQPLPVDEYTVYKVNLDDSLQMVCVNAAPTNPIETKSIWFFGYDANNNLITRTDAKNQTITLEYDNLNRLTKKNYPDGSGVDYYYDETGHGYANGRLTQVEYPGGAESYAYDARGRETEVTQAIEGISRTQNMTYNSLDQVVTHTLPDGEVVTSTYDAGGMLSGLKGSSNYVTDIDYYASGKISKTVYGNGVRTDYDYYDTAGESDASAGTNFSYRLKQIRVYKSSDLLNLTYEYDKSDNVKVKRDALNTDYTETYGYDDLSRLISANSTSYGSKTFQYNTLNNIILKDNRTYQYDIANPYKLVNDGKHSYTYDSNGSITGRSDGRVIAWDSENRVISISNAGKFAYNADEQRIKKTENGVTTYYFFDDYEEEYTGGTKSKTVKYYFADDQRIAENSSVDGLRFYHQDHLDSSTAITDASGTLVLRNNYAPYGEDAESQGSATINYKFTGKEKDDSGLYYYGARYYDPEMGRFISVDPAKDGDNWYAYCNNNPVKYVDPTGKWAWAIPWLEKIVFSLILSVQYYSAECSIALNATAYQSGSQMTVQAASDAVEKGVKGGQAKNSSKSNSSGNSYKQDPNNGQKIKPVNLPSWKIVKIDMKHIVSGHTQSGSRAIQSLEAGKGKDLFKNMSLKQIENAVRQAYRFSERIYSQGERVFVRGQYNKMTIEMWVNKTTKTIESAWPK